MTTTTTKNMMKCHRNVNFESMDTERSARKNDGF